ncbi:MAG: hypothetical protein K5930_03800 [Treponemataceae bacterium]|nr:hypothetical protein [Treponemataceae bacterium]
MKIGLSSEELKKRTSKEYLITKTMLKKDAPEYEKLAEGDKKALKELVKAAVILEEAFLKMDDARNLPFRDFLNAEIEKGNEDAKLAMILFKAQKGINTVDMNAQKFSLLEAAQELPGKGLYPADLTKEEFHKILKEMLESGKKEEVAKILNQRSIIVREGKGLKALDYTEAFKEEFSLAADHLLNASQTSTNKDFNEFLKLQAKALTVADPMADAYADKKWASLQDTPLEFTITRENYEDEMTETVYENEELSALLKKNDISPVSKDMLGFRVGIVNKEGTEKLLEIKKYLPELAKNMPFADKYEQNIPVAGAAQGKGAASGSGESDVKQTMVDVDIVTVKGDVGAYRAGITLAENLPNDDKLSISIGGGRRNVYHRQIRAISDKEQLQKILDATLDKKLHQFYENEADHWFTIGHENGHSLGPKSGTEALGKYKSIIEENKADMISMAMLDKLVELGMYTDLQKKQIITVFAADSVLKAKPNLSQAHRVRTVMQLNHFIKEGAFQIKDGVITIDFEKAVPAAQSMLRKIIDVQLSRDFEKGEKYVMENFIWSDDIEKLAEKLSQVKKTLNGCVEEELADELAR